MSKKILIVGQHFWPESFRINDICDFLVDEKNCEVDVLCGIPNYPKGKFFKGYSYIKNRKQAHNGINIRRAFEIPRGNNTNMRVFINYMSFPISSLFHIPRLLTKKYDKIFIYQLSPVTMAITGIIVGKIKKIETTMYVLDLWPENLFSVLTIKNPLMNKLVTVISHWHYKKVDKLVVLSDLMKAKLVKIRGNDNNIIVLPQACEKIYETPIHDKNLSKRFAGTFNIVFTGNISPAQSFNTMIDAAEKLLKNGKKDIRWIIVGDGMSRSQVETEIAKRQLTNYFSFEGNHPIEDMPKYTKIADILVGCLVKSNLLEATIPAKVMSYIASGKPVALAMDGEVQDLINKTIRCGYAGPAGDSDQLYKNITRLYDMNPDQREAMGRLAKNYHFKYFERNIILQKLYNFIFSSQDNKSDKV